MGLLFVPMGDVDELEAGAVRAGLDGDDVLVGFGAGFEE